MKQLFRKTIVIGILFSLLIIYFIYLSTTITPVLKGFYQSEWVSDNGNSEGKIIQISIWEDGKFMEFITNRLVNQGTFEKMDDVQYYFDGDETDFDIILGKDNSFEIEISKLNSGEPIKLENIDDTPCNFETQWDDLEEYKTYLK